MDSDFCELACDILRATKDGDELAPLDLKLLELAVNGVLNEAGKAAFMELHRNATKPEGYTVPWFLGIEHMTRDHSATSTGRVCASSISITIIGSSTDGVSG
jgi:hypothetical protein